MFQAKQESLLGGFEESAVFVLGRIAHGYHMNGDHDDNECCQDHDDTALDAANLDVCMAMIESQLDLVLNYSSKATEE